MSSSKINWLTILSIILSIFSAILIGSYFLYITLRGGNIYLSGDPSDWAIFGNFISPIFSLISIIAILLSISINNTNLEIQRESDRLRDERNYRIQKLDELLSLVFDCYSAVYEIYKVRIEINKVDGQEEPRDSRMKSNLVRRIDDISQDAHILVSRMQSLSSLHFGCTNGIYIHYFLECWNDVITGIVHYQRGTNLICYEANKYLREETQRYIKKIKEAKEYSPLNDEIEDMQIESSISNDVFSKFHKRTQNAFLETKPDSEQTANFL